MKAVIDRNSAEYARAVQKAFDLQPSVTFTDVRGHFEVQGSAGNSYDVFVDENSNYACSCRFGRKEALCYHVVAVDVHRREALARFEAEVRSAAFLAGSRTLAIIRQRELEAHRAVCAKCGAGEECRKAIKLLERMGSLARQIAQTA
ncbi:MAG TPA: hypothetical protein VEX70_00960 [Pyrinomonadaceae bacterium]|nr:hypothetical protein [Pyrinomonadaceae bacterium]